MEGYSRRRAARGTVALLGLLLAAVASAHAWATAEDRARPLPAVATGRPVALLPAHALIGRVLRDPSGRTLGRIRHLLIDPAGGRLRYVLIGQRAAGTHRLDVAVPWASLGRVPATGPLAVRLAAPQLAGLPHLIDPGDSPTAHPLAVAQLFAYAQNPSPLSPAHSQNLPPPPGEIALPAGSHTTEDAGPPVLASANLLRGVAVDRADGRRLGRIVRIMLDTAGGRIAFVLVAEAGRTARSRLLPLPVGVLVAPPSGSGAETLTLSGFWLRQIPRLPQPAPRQVGSLWLAGLYRICGLGTYRTGS